MAPEGRRDRPTKEPCVPLDFGGDGFRHSTRRLPSRYPESSINGDHAMPTAEPIDEFYEAAKQKFAYISQHMSDFGGWKLGNSLDTMIDYLALALAHRDVHASAAESFGRDVSGLCKTWIYSGNPTWTWFDDLGWFVISTGRASRQSFFGKNDLQNPFSGFSA